MDTNEIITPEMKKFSEEFPQDFWKNIELLMSDPPSDELSVYLRGWCAVLGTLALDNFVSIVTLLQNDRLRAAFMLGRAIIEYHVRLRYYILQAHPSITKFQNAKSSLANLKKKMHAARDWDNSEKKRQIELNSDQLDRLDFRGAERTLAELAHETMANRSSR